MKSSGRKALQPRNIILVPAAETLKKPKDDELLFSKEKLVVILPVPVEVESMDASLAEELSAFKKKLERLRDDEERSEKMLEERDGAMEVQMKHLLERGEIQKRLEIQVDRLFRLKELHAKISPIRSLRAKEQEKRKREPVAAEEDKGTPSSID